MCHKVRKIRQIYTWAGSDACMAHCMTTRRGSLSPSSQQKICQTWHYGRCYYLHYVDPVNCEITIVNSNQWFQATPSFCWLGVGFVAHIYNFFLIWITPEGFTTVVANEGLEKARAYLNQVPRDRRLYIPSEGCGVNTYSLFWAELSRLLGEKIPVAIVGLEPGTPGSAVQHFNHLATKQQKLDCWINWIRKTLASQKRKNGQFRVIVCWMHFHFWKIACQCVFSTIRVSCCIT